MYLKRDLVMLVILARVHPQETPRKPTDFKTTTCGILGACAGMWLPVRLPEADTEPRLRFLLR